MPNVYAKPEMPDGFQEKPPRSCQAIIRHLDKKRAAAFLKGTKGATLVNVCDDGTDFLLAKGVEETGIAAVHALIKEDEKAGYESKKKLEKVAERAVEAAFLKGKGPPTLREIAKAAVKQPVKKR